MNHRSRIGLSTPVSLAGVMALAACTLLFGCGGGTSKTGPDFSDTASASERQSAARALAARAQQAEQAGKPLEAIALYQEAARTYDGLPSVWNNLGVALLKQQRHLDAVEAFQEAATRSPTDPRPLENIAIAYHERGWEQKALEYFNRALEVDPQSLPALRGVARSAKRLNVADVTSLERVHTAMMLETDPAWVQFFQREQFRMQYQIENAKKGAGERRASAPTPDTATVEPSDQAISGDSAPSQDPN